MWVSIFYLITWFSSSFFIQLILVYKLIWQNLFRKKKNKMFLKKNIFIYFQLNSHRQYFIWKRNWINFFSLSQIFFWTVQLCLQQLGVWIWFEHFVVRMWFFLSFDYFCFQIILIIYLYNNFICFTSQFQIKYFLLLFYLISTINRLLLLYNSTLSEWLEQIEYINIY